MLREQILTTLSDGNFYSGEKLGEIEIENDDKSQSGDVIIEIENAIETNVDLNPEVVIDGEIEIV